MNYSTGDTVKFRLESGEIQEGEVLFIERGSRGDIIYINSINRLNRWAYRVSGKRVISKVCKRKRTI